MPLVPYVIEQTSRGERMYDIYSRLLKDRIIFLGSVIDSEVANVTVAQLLLMDNQSQELDISLYINSPGGDVYAGLAIYDTMQYISAPVSTICVGLAASMGAVLLAAGRPAKRYALPHSRVMIHQPHLPGGSRGQVSDIEIQAREASHAKRTVQKLIQEHTKQDVQRIEKDLDRDFWMSAEEAREYGLVDLVVQRDSRVPAGKR